MALPSQVDTAVPFLLLDDTGLSSPYRFYTLAVLFRKESADPSCDGVNSEPSRSLWTHCWARLGGRPGNGHQVGISASLAACPHPAAEQGLRPTAC